MIIKQKEEIEGREEGMYRNCIAKKDNVEKETDSLQSHGKDTREGKARREEKRKTGQQIAKRRENQNWRKKMRTKEQER